MESLKKGGRISRRKTKVKTKIKVKKTTTKQTARGKNISQFKGTGAQVIVNVKNPISRAREQLQQAQSAGLSSVLPTILASQQASEGRMEQLMRQGETAQNYMNHAHAVRANAVGLGNDLAANDAQRAYLRAAAEKRAIGASERKLQEDFLQVQQPATESRELASAPATESRELASAPVRTKKPSAFETETSSSESSVGYRRTLRSPLQRVAFTASSRVPLPSFKSSEEESDVPKPASTKPIPTGSTKPIPTGRRIKTKKGETVTTANLREELNDVQERLDGKPSPSVRKRLNVREQRLRAEIRRR